MYLTTEEELYYDNYFELFMTDGWKQFIEEIEDSLDDYHIEHIKDEAHLKTVQGQLQMLNRFANFENAIRNAYDQNKEAENAETV